ncbi:MAG: hypothetical protein ACI4QT_09460 [Kiritimatiellia bacterium]
MAWGNQGRAGRPETEMRPMDKKKAKEAGRESHKEILLFFFGRTLKP